MTEPSVTKVAVYIRWSTEDQGAGTTLDVQQDACKAYIHSQGWSLKDDLIFVDDGVSGGTMDRPALSRLRSAVQSGAVDCVVVYKLDRLSRSVPDMVKLVLDEWNGTCFVKSAREPIDTLSPTGKMFFYQLMSFAEWERNVIRDRMFAGKLRRAQEGRNPGITLPYGYAWSADGTVVVNQAAAPVVQRIFRLYLAGFGCRSISQALAQEGYPAPAGNNRWAQSTLSHILSNPAYMGRWVFGKKTTVLGRRVRAEEPLVVKEGFFPALVSVADFEAVQRLRSERPGVGRKDRHSGRAMTSRSLLTGVLSCTCGSACVGRHVNGYRYYLCNAAHKAGAQTCGAGCIDQGVLNQLLVRKLMAEYGGAHIQQRLVEQVIQHTRTRHREAVVAVEAATKELGKVDEQARKLNGLLLASRLSLDEYRALQRDLHTQVQTGQERYRLASEAERSLRASCIQGPLRLAGGNEWEHLPPTAQKQLLRQFVARVVVYRKKGTRQVTCEVVWRTAVQREPEAFQVEITP